MKIAYKLELLKKWEIHDVFHISLLEQETTGKEQVDKNVTEFETADKKKYEVETIWNSMVYAKEFEAGDLPSL